jgi:sulfur carrier protein ThiS
MKKILLINNDGAGFADYIEVAEGTTVEKLFAERVPHGKPQDYLIRVNRQPVAADQVLQEGDRVSLTPYVAHSIMWRPTRVIGILRVCAVLDTT